jgi:hypothetical protein
MACQRWMADGLRGTSLRWLQLQLQLQACRGRGITGMSCPRPATLERRTSQVVASGRLSYRVLRYIVLDGMQVQGEEREDQRRTTAGKRERKGRSKTLERRPSFAFGCSHYGRGRSDGGDGIDAGGYRVEDEGPEIRHKS